MLKQILIRILNKFTLGRLLGTLLTILMVASTKYYLSGNFYLEYSEYIQNVNVAFLSWVLNIVNIAFFTEYLAYKGINFNLKEIFFGLNTLNEGKGSSLQDFKPKLYNAMNNEESYSNNSLDKGKGVDRDIYPQFGLDKGKDVNKNFNPNNDINKGTMTEGSTSQNNSLGKVKNIPNLNSPPPVEAHMVTWSKVFPGMDPASIFKPQRTNPGPGFNVPGGEVPIRDEICQHIDYNTHFLNQFKRMDLETAIEQRNNYLLLARVMETKIDYANNALSKLPIIPTNENQFNLKNKIMEDLNNLSKEKIRAEARATLITSRIEYIEHRINKN